MSREFIPRLGQTDYTNARWAPAVNCVVQHNDKILLVKRSKDMNIHPGKWNGIGGYLDDKKSLREKVYEELQEELGLSKEQIASIRLGEVFDADDSLYNKTFVLHPVLVEVDTNAITLDWEAEEHVWIRRDEIGEYDVIPSFHIVLEKLGV